MPCTRPFRRECRRAARRGFWTMAESWNAAAAGARWREENAGRPVNQEAERTQLPFRLEEDGALVVDEKAAWEILRTYYLQSAAANHRLASTTAIGVLLLQAGRITEEEFRRRAIG